ncbi:hypothetical protein JMUB6875_48100 [Nocardia sp. JMUB6875]|uniref:transposase n=1 Tax=Nocardia sp. JMUB6875 TaxID=3158170 RepID=UPI0032E7432E
MVRDGKVLNGSSYVIIGVTSGGNATFSGLWAGDGGEGAKFRLEVLTEIKNRCVADVYIAVCAGLKGLPDAINTVWDRTICADCVIYLLHNIFRYAAHQYWDETGRGLKPVYTTATAAASSSVRRVRRQMGRPLPGNRQTMGERLDRIRIVPGL